MKPTTITLTLAMALGAACLSGCDTGSRGEDGVDSTNPGSTGTNPGGGNNGLQVSGLAPQTGSINGGTAVSITGNGFAAGLSVHFFDSSSETPGPINAATNVVVVSASQITCDTPAHAAGVVDVRVVQSTGAFATLNNAYTFDPNGGGTNPNALARVADFGNPSAWDVELLEWHNQARRDPAAEGTRLGITLSTTNGYVVRPPLAMNQFLTQASGAHTADMIARNFYSHWNPDGVGPNGRILSTAYDLNAAYGTDPVANGTENIGVSSAQTQFNTPQKVHDAFIIDAGQNPPKHRDNILGRAGSNQANAREVGMGVTFNSPQNPTPAQFTNPPISPIHWVTQEIARTKTDRAIISGVVYNDGNNDGLASANPPYTGNAGGEGVGGVTVTLTHASGFTISTTTSASGYYAFETFVDTQFTVEINGTQTAVNVAGDNIKVDLVNGTPRTY
jgi:hypothetical protein